MHFDFIFLDATSLKNLYITKLFAIFSPCITLKYLARKHNLFFKRYLLLKSVNINCSAIMFISINK